MARHAKAPAPKKVSKKKVARDSTVVKFPDRGQLERPARKTLVGRTPNQKTYLSLMRSKLITFGLGPASAGKTYLSTSQAAREFQDQKYKRIIVTRPAVPAEEEEYGFLPGDQNEKTAPWFEPVREVLEEWLGVSQVETLIEMRLITFSPMGFMRGKTFRDAFVILDEAQNTTPKQMRLFLTRIGENCRVVINGDLSQKDIQGPSGLKDAVERLDDLEEIGVVRFDLSDCQRDPIVRKILERYD